MTETVEIERMGYGPEGIAHLESGKTVFVAGAVTGDVAEVALTQEKPNFAKAKAVRITQPSPLRGETPPCGLCTECGGCPWAALSYEAQLQAKRAHVVEALVRTAKIERETADALVAPCVPSKREWGYRNKIELAAFTDKAGKFTLGMHAAHSDDIIAVQACPLANRLIESAPKAITGVLRFLNSREDLSIFRVELRASLRTKSVELALWTPPGQFPRTQVAHTLQSALKSTSIVRVLAEPGKARKVKKVEVLDGEGFWREEFNLTFAEPPQAAAAQPSELAASNPTRIPYAVSAPSFFQVNTAQAEKMVQLALDNLALDNLGNRDSLALDNLDNPDNPDNPGNVANKNIADLYSGVGTFSIPLALANPEARVTAIEAAGSSARDARRNIKNAHANVDAICEDVARVFAEIGTPDALLVDPPRAGLAPEVIDHIAAARPAAMIYVSCDPQTLARDTRRLQDRGFSLTSVTPLDLFPQTYHVEAMAMFC